MRRAVRQCRGPRAGTVVALTATLLLALGACGGEASADTPTSGRVRPARVPVLTTRLSASQIAALPVVSLPAVSAGEVHDDSLSGVVHGVLGTLSNPIGAGVGTLASLSLNALDSWVLSGAGAALNAAASAISATTAPRLQSTWFSSVYWRVAGLGALLTLPFLFAAAAQALLRSDLSLLVRAAFGYLPMALLGVSLAAPLTMLLLAVTDQMCAVVASVGQDGGTHFLAAAAVAAGSSAALDGSPFVGFLVGLLIVAAAIALLIELLIREAAVYVVVLMLPLAFAAFVWPARRSVAIRTLEVLIALIFSKFVVVAVLSLGGAAFDSGSQSDSAATLLTAMALVLMSTFAPVALFRLIPFAELAAGASGAIRSEMPRAIESARSAGGVARAASGHLGAASEWLADVPAQMRDQARDAGQGGARAPLRPELPAGGSGPAPGTGGNDPAAGVSGGAPRAAASEPPGASGAEPADELEAALQADDNSLQLWLGGHEHGRPAFRPAQNAAGTQPGPLDSRRQPRQETDEGGLL